MQEYLIKTLRESYKTIYGKYYVNGYNTELVEKGDKLIKKNKAVATLAAVVRGDLISSDREVAALYTWAKENELI